MRPPLPTLSTERPLPSTAPGVRRFDVEDPLLNGQLLIGHQALAERAEALVWGGPFMPLRIEQGPERTYVHLPERLLFTLADTKPLPAPAAFAIALRLAEALDRVHDNQVVHGHLHPDSVGFDALGRLRIAPALHHPLTRVEGHSPTPADDCLALGHVIAHMLGWMPPDWTELPLDGVHARSGRTILRGLLRERVRLRLSPARAVRQTLASLFARSQIADPDAPLRAWLSEQGLPQAQLDSPGKVVLPLAEMGESRHERQVPEVTSAAAEDEALAQVTPETTPESSPRAEPAMVRIGLDPSREDALVLEFGEADIEGEESTSLALAEWDDEVEAERVEAERVEATRIEATRIETERIETERVEAERIENKRVAGIEAERVEAERVEAERVEAERVEDKRVAAESAAQLEAEETERLK
ncbi:MAG: hypothetical protein ACI9VR_003227, partial [Cognaticolwellia sp.]